MQKIAASSASSVAAANNLLLGSHCGNLRPEHVRSRDGEECGELTVTAPTSWWFCMLQKRAERMYDEKLDLDASIIWTSEAKAAVRTNDTTLRKRQTIKNVSSSETLSTNE